MIILQWSDMLSPLIEVGLLSHGIFWFQSLWAIPVCLTVLNVLFTGMQLAFLLFWCSVMHSDINHKHDDMLNIPALLYSMWVLHWCVHKHDMSLSLEPTYQSWLAVYLALLICSPKALQTYPKHCLLLIFQSWVLATCFSCSDLLHKPNHVQCYLSILKFDIVVDTDSGIRMMMRFLWFESWIAHLLTKTEILID